MSEPFRLGPHNYAALLEALPTALYVIGQDRRIVFWNDDAERISGYLRYEVMGKTCGEDLLAHCDADNQTLCGAGCPLAETMRDGRPRERHLFLRHKNGQRLPVRVRATPVRDAEGVIVGAAETFDEHVHIGHSDLQLHVVAGRQALDPLTGVPGASALAAQLEAHLSEHRRTEVPFGLLGIQIGDIADLGHTRGRQGVEEIVKAVAQTLAHNLPAGDFLSRWSDDRFMIILANCPAPVLERVAAMLGRILDMISVDWWGDRLAVKAAMGGTVVDPRDTAATLMTRVNLALQHAQSGAKERFQTVYKKKESA
jgi:PAS domain S-box-containing protein